MTTESLARLHRSRRYLKRRGMSLVEVIVSVGLMTMLLVPMVSMMKASHSVWSHFNIQHRSGSDRASVVRYMTRTLGNATEILNQSTTTVRFRNTSGVVETIRQSGSQIIHERFGRSDVIAENIGAIRFDRLQSFSQPFEGTLLRVQVISGTDASNASRSGEVWIRKPI